MKYKIDLIIRKKKLVPTKRAIVHATRSDWTFVRKVQFNEVMQLFNYFNPNAKIVTDSQLAKLILDNYGTGIYSILYYRKGKKGFGSLMKFECKIDVWARLPKHLTADEREKQQLSLEARRLRKVINNAEHPDQREEAQKELNEISEDIDLTKELVGLNNQGGPAPYLRSTLPVFKFHEYEDYNVIPKQIVEFRVEKQKEVKPKPKIKEKEFKLKVDNPNYSTENNMEVYNNIW